MYQKLFWKGIEKKKYTQDKNFFDILKKRY